MDTGISTERVGVRKMYKNRNGGIREVLVTACTMQCT